MLKENIKSWHAAITTVWRTISNKKFEVTATNVQKSIDREIDFNEN